jgi:hypothetical protein
MRVSLIFLSFLLIFSIETYSQVKKNVDEFTGTVSYKTEQFEVKVEKGGAQSSSGFFYYEDEAGFAFLHYSVADEWQHQNAKKMYFLIDGERKELNVITSGSDTKTSGGSMILIESNGVQIPKSTLQKIPGSESTRFKFSNSIYEIPETGKKYAEKLLNRVK